MMQIAKRLNGTVRACDGCQGQPVHVLVKGPGEHFLECPRCLVRTARMDSLNRALAAWESVSVEATKVEQQYDPKVLVFLRKKA